MQTQHKKTSRWLIRGLIVSLFFMSSCLDKIELEIPRGFDNTLIIQGTLIKGSPSTFDLSVSRLFDFTPESTGRVNVSSVVLEDESGNTVDIERSGTGTYQAVFPDGNGMMDVQTGKAYKVRVATFDGRTFESTLEPLLDVPRVDSVSFTELDKELIIKDEEIDNDTVVRFALNTPLAPPNSTEQVSLRWDVRRVYKLTDSPIEFGVEQKTCYVTERVEVTEVKVFDGANSGNSRLDNYPIFDQSVDFHFAEGYYIEIIQSSLSRGAFNHWNQVSQVIEREGNMFEAPVGAVSTNFVNINDTDDKAFGYFYATVKDTARVYVSPEFARFPRDLCPPNVPPPPGGGCPLDLCCDCLSADISTTFKPSFWKE